MENERRLYRSRYDSVIGGVSGGLGKYFSIDPLIIRILFLVFAFVIGGGIVAYIILWIVMPVEPDYFFDKYGSRSSSGGTARDTTNPNETYDRAADSISNPAYSSTNQPKTASNGALIAGIFLIVFGMILIADRFLYQINFRDVWPFLVLVIGVVIIAGSFRK